MGKLSSILGLSLAMISSAQTTGKIDWGRLNGRMRPNPEGYRCKPTKRRLKVKLARKAKLRNQRNG